MRRIVRLALGVSVFAAVACSPDSGGRSQGAESPSPPAVAEPPEPVVRVTTARVRRGSIRQRVVAPASLVARRESRIGAQVRGRIEQVFVRQGDRVAAGDPLFQIDRVPYHMALRRAEAGRELARAERLQIEADLRRLGELRRSDIVSEHELDRSQTLLAVATSREKQATEAVSLARHNIGQTLVRAPFGGSIAQRLADEGTTALAQPQTIVVVLQETDELEARADIPEGELSVIAAGDPAVIQVEGRANPIVTEVAVVADTIDPATRTYRISMRVPNPDHSLRAGVFARVEILPRAERNAILVPHEAIRSEGGQTRVLVVRDGRAIAVPVRLGIVSEKEAEVLGGVRVDSEVVVGEAARSMAPGMRVRVMERLGKGAP